MASPSPRDKSDAGAPTPTYAVDPWDRLVLPSPFCDASRTTRERERRAEIVPPNNGEVDHLLPPNYYSNTHDTSGVRRLFDQNHGPHGEDDRLLTTEDFPQQTSSSPAPPMIPSAADQLLYVPELLPTMSTSARGHEVTPNSEVPNSEVLEDFPDPADMCFSEGMSRRQSQEDTFNTQSVFVPSWIARGGTAAHNVPLRPAANGIQQTRRVARLRGRFEWSTTAASRERDLAHHAGGALWTVHHETSAPAAQELVRGPQFNNRIGSVDPPSDVGWIRRRTSDGVVPSWGPSPPTWGRHNGSLLRRSASAPWPDGYWSSTSSGDRVVRCSGRISQPGLTNHPRYWASSVNAPSTARRFGSRPSDDHRGRGDRSQLCNPRTPGRTTEAEQSEVEVALKAPRWVAQPLDGELQHQHPSELEVRRGDFGGGDFDAGGRTGGKFGEMLVAVRNRYARLGRTR